MTRLSLLLASLAVMFIGCETIAPPRLEIPLSIESLQNAEYQSVVYQQTGLGKVRLVNGSFEKRLGPEPSNIFMLHMTKWQASGNLDGDGVPDAVAVLTSSGGGSGIFFELAAVLNRNGTPQHVASVSLGDRIEIQSIRIEHRVILVCMRCHGAHEALATAKELCLRKFRLANGRLVLIKESPRCPERDGNGLYYWP